MTSHLIISDGNNNVTGGYELHYLGSNGENILITFPEANSTTGIITSVYVLKNM